MRATWSRTAEVVLLLAAWLITREGWQTRL